MPDFELAVDVSNYTGRISRDQALCLRDRGVTHLIAGTQVASVTRGQIEAAIAAGLRVDAYVYLYWRRDVVSQVRDARDAIAGLPAGRLWLDSEDDPAGLSPSRILHLIRQAVAACEGEPCGIYTGRWWWVPATGDSSEFAGIPLWHAEYTPSPEQRPDFDAFRPYGGWTRPAMWQFQGTSSLCGLSVDLNLRQSPTGSPAKGDSASPAIDSVELALLRAGQRFDRARALGRYIFRPAADPATVELQQLEDGHAVSFDPPYLLRVD